MPAHIALAVCLTQTEKNKFDKRGLKPCLLREAYYLIIHYLPIARSALPYFLCLLPKALTLFFFLFAFLWDNSPRQDGAERRINVGQKEFYLEFIGQMLFNVPGCKRRFASPYKGLRSKTRAGKLWRSEAWERAQRPT
jgi:hypothetical protein